MTHEVLLAKLWVLKTAGFILRIPGGSSRKGDHSSFVAIYRSNKDFEIEVLVVPYNPTITIERKYDEDEFDEVPVGSLALKVSEQTGVKIYDPIRIGLQEAKNNRSEVRSEKHLKLLYITDKYDDSGIRVIGTTDGRLDPPEWVPINLLKKHLCPQHQWMIPIIENHLISQTM
ncbi:MAG: hypothetical protein KBB91_01635 [Candidatus Pacebacteria bacterium]|jgi:hypothetical protein|nr:hypothetical protein [Candidatus Paceibacterota bacterium]MBP9701099.1 hypothetical protein [Candidatus Paceibacterota bacterium]